MNIIRAARLVRSVTRANRVVMSRLAYLLCNGSLLRNYSLPPFCDGPVHFACPAKSVLCSYRQQFISRGCENIWIRRIFRSFYGQHGACSDDHQIQLRRHLGGSTSGSIIGPTCTPALEFCAKQKYLYLRRKKFLRSTATVASVIVPIVQQ